MTRFNTLGRSFRGKFSTSLLSAVLLGAGFMLSNQFADAQSLVWESTFNGISASALEETEGVVVDDSGNVFVTGLSGNGSGSAICTMRLKPTGGVQWTRLETKQSLCGGMWGRTPLVQDGAGNLIVAGAEFTNNSANWNPLLIAYSPAGATLIRRVYNMGPFASFDALAIDNTGIYVAAHNNPNNGNPHVVATLKLNGAGDVLWSGSFTPSTFWGIRDGIVVTGSGVYTAAADKFTKRDLTTGAILWQKDVTMANGGSALAADTAGNVYLTAFSSGVAKYDAAGNVLQVFSAISSQVSDLDVDSIGNIYVTGDSASSSKSGTDILTQKYNAAGNLIWSTTFGKSGPYSDEGIAVTVRGGYVYVGGSKYNKNLDMCTLKYTGGN